MTELQYGTPDSSILFAVVAIAIGIAVWSGFSWRRRVRRFASSDVHSALLPPASSFRRGASVVLTTGSLALLVLALLDIRWGETQYEVPQKGIEVIFALDVSRSMLAEDTSPNRLERARQQISDMVNEMAGDRVGLVVFAGDTRQSVPLTTHYDEFKQVLETVGPHSVARGGSRLGDAIQAAADAFISKTNDHKAILVFTDGEDQESEPVRTARELYQEKGIRIFTVGLGDMEQGSRIPDPGSRSGGFVRHQGQQVVSRMNGEILKQIASVTQGAWIPAGTRRVNMADVYHGYVANVDQTEFETARINAFVPRFQWFAAPALLLLLVEIGITTRRTRRRHPADLTSGNETTSKQPKTRKSRAA